MPFPSSTRVVFQRNPIVEVICQFRFPTILAIAAELPSQFQERIRRAYPLYQRLGGASAFPQELTPAPQLRIQLAEEPVLHQFQTEDAKRVISLTQDFVAVTERDYSRWESFRPEIQSAETAVREIYEPTFYQRVGLRYQNLIDRDSLGLADEPWDRLITSYFAGLLGAWEVRERVEAARSEALVRLDEVDGGFVTIRHGLVRMDPTKGRAYLIDADFYTETRCNSERAFAALDTFHRLAGDLFRWSISEELRGALEPESVD